VRLRPVADSGDVIQLGEGIEYFLLENRGAVEGDYIDADILVRGLSVTHVNLAKYPDGTEHSWPLRLFNCLNCDRWDPMLMNEQADGKFELQRPGRRRDDIGDLFQVGDEFKPSPRNETLGPDFQELSSNFYDGTASGVTIRNIRIDGEDILVDVEVQEACASIECPCGCEAGRCTTDCPEPEPDVGQADDVGDAGEPAPPPAASNDGCSTNTGGQFSPLFWARR
jgi:hypothetical protein